MAEDRRLLALEDSFRRNATPQEQLRRDNPDLYSGLMDLRTTGAAGLGGRAFGLAVTQHIAEVEQQRQEDVRDRRAAAAQDDLATRQALHDQAVRETTERNRILRLTPAQRQAEMQAANNAARAARQNIAIDARAREREARAQERTEAARVRTEAQQRRDENMAAARTARDTAQNAARVSRDAANAAARDASRQQRVAPRPSPRRPQWNTLPPTPSGGGQPPAPDSQSFLQTPVNQNPWRFF